VTQPAGVAVRWIDLLPFGSLPPYRPRRFVPASVDLGDWTQLAPLFDQLQAQIQACSTAAELEQWLLDWSELTAALDQEGTQRYIAMTCHTDDAEAERAYLHFIEQIEPQTKPRQFELARCYLQHPLRTALPRDRYLVFDRERQVQVELFRPENVPLETEEAKLGQQYQKLTGSLTVQFRGEEKTLPQLAPYLEEPDRATRQEAWELAARRRLQEADRFDDLFDALFQLRHQIARNAGFDTYTPYAFRARCRFDYTPADCLQFHATIESEVMPLVRRLHARRRQHLNVPTLRPWDLDVDPLHRPPLRPFATADQLLDRTERIFARLDPSLADQFRRLRKLRLLDLENRKGKAPGGYQSSLAEARLPFIFMNAVGVHRDVETLLHEAGHAFHALATQPEDLYAYRTAPLEFCEVASMSMELLGSEFLDEFYPPADAQRARRNLLEGIVRFLPWMATVDAFQHWLYEHPNHTRAERTAAWLALMDRFGGDVDWSGYEAERAHWWHRQLHIFLHPFYYIEYGIAQLGALQVWANARRDRAQALAAWRRALALGNSRPLPELFEAAGCRFDFSVDTLRPLMRLVQAELDQLD